MRLGAHILHSARPRRKNAFFLLIKIKRFADLQNWNRNTFVGLDEIPSSPYSKIASFRACQIVVHNRRDVSDKRVKPYCCRVGMRNTRATDAPFRTSSFDKLNMDDFFQRAWPFKPSSTRATK
eukprot:GEMP01099584.1.p1 GENE.GEMP01099584.1~~GEMP01099584.1.p1  ORF type:complete len:123 (-),score=1.48 GEMP01099584.1:146-514(-)